MSLRPISTANLECESSALAFGGPIAKRERSAAALLPPATTKSFPVATAFHPEQREGPRRSANPVSAQPQNLSWEIKMSITKKSAILTLFALSFAHSPVRAQQPQMDMSQEHMHHRNIQPVAPVYPRLGRAQENAQRK